jgi:hypothetical protein
VQQVVIHQRWRKCDVFVVYFQWFEENKDEMKEKGSKVLFGTGQTKVRKLTHSG